MLKGTVRRRRTLPLEDSPMTGTTQPSDTFAQLNAQIAELFRQGKYQQALPLARQAAERAAEDPGGATPGPERLELARGLVHLGNLYRELNQFNNAEQPFLQALAIQRAALGPTHPDYAGSL